MVYFFYKIIFPVLIFFFAHTLFAAPLTFIRDTIGTSAPSLPATHEIQFTVANAVPSGGKIIIVPEPGAFIIPAAFNFLDADLAVATSSVYADRTLLGTPSATDDGMAVVPGSSGSFTFTLGGTAGINAGEKVQIEFGNNAAFAATGTNFIINPTPAVSYRIGIRTENASGTQIDYGTTMIAVVLPVTGGPVNTTIVNPPVISNGLPTGLLPSGTGAVELSVQTDILATCKYSTLPDIPFASSTGAFLKTGGLIHSGAVITGLSNGVAYNYYVRCRNFQLLANMTDYIISFSIGVVPPPPPPPPLTSSGGASGGPSGGGNFLKTADVAISGTSYPSSKVFILKDGKEAASMTASGDGAWNAKISGLERGTYTFGIYAIDSKNKKSATVSSTVSLLAGTINAVTRILLPPTLRAEKTSVDQGRPFMISGQGIPKSVTEISLLKQGTSESTGRTATATVDTKGEWSVDFNTQGLSTGGYEARAKSLLSGGESSGFGSALPLGIGQDAAPDLAGRSDLNNDGKVNLIDFSILLFSWGTDNAVADINQNGTVDLADFSIMIFYWTG